MHNTTFKLLYLTGIAGMLVICFVDLSELRAWQVVLLFAPLTLVVAGLALQAHQRERVARERPGERQPGGLWVPRDIDGQRRMDAIDLLLMSVMLVLVLYRLVWG